MSRLGQRKTATRSLHRSWALRVLALLLFVQATALVGITLLSGAQVDWRLAADNGALSPQVRDVVILGGMFIPCAVLALLAAVGMLTGVRVGWLLAMLAQAVILGGCLWLYLTTRPSFIYALMLTGIVVVLYLNSRDVRVAFHLRPLTEPTETDGES